MRVYLNSTSWFKCWDTRQIEGSGVDGVEGRGGGSNPGQMEAVVLPLTAHALRMVDAEL